MRCFVVGTVIMAALLGGGSGFACGDKLLAISRGIRFQRFHAAHRANLLIYAAAARGGAALDSARLQTTLKREVHNLQVVHDRSQLEGALRSGAVDLVLVDFADVASLARELQSAASRPVILPVLRKPSKVDFAAALKEYRFAVKADADEFGYLTAIEDAMKSKTTTNAKS